MADLRSAQPPEPGEDDHLRGPADAPLVVEYADYECPYCARTDAMLADSAVRHVFRHFPVPSKHPRARALAGAAEAAALQGRFWDMHELLFADQGRIDDPHLWERARRLELDLERFERDRRSEAVAERIARDFRSGVRAGVTTTPTLFVDGVAHPGVPGPELAARLARA
ncbi:MAG: Na+/H+ antiporter NhaA type [uncultured Solirubrobacterales bacterium]|uniref:Na+/H+ antiporter NhaA type n=1 Tax=uncultured Solirubrobacterales bacterium TaxID=768556 RepID=A0A6J4RX26_9ACTN|nr:MAG: Na+/H+ antiporter NhaA type [uncultured Solirubrobacterales bacterium]